MTTELTNLERNTLAMPEHVRQRAKDYASASSAQNTKHAYKSAWLDFQRFCQQRAYNAMPTSDAVLMEYLTELAEKGQKVSTIQTKLAGIAKAHELQGQANPTHTSSVRLLMQGIRRKLGTASQQKAPIKLEDLRRMVETLGHDLKGKRDRAILLLGFAGAFRRSEIAGLEVEDLHFANGEMNITLRHSKTDQEGHGQKKRIPQIADESLDPVNAVRDWMQAAHIESGALFRAIDRWGHIRNANLTDKVIALIVKETAESAGLEPRQFAGHSLRAGFVTQAAEDETPEWAIAEVTGHKSRAMLQRYIRDAGLGQVKAIRRAFGESQP